MMSPTGDMPGDAGGCDLRAAFVNTRKNLAGVHTPTTSAFLVEFAKSQIVLSGRGLLHWPAHADEVFARGARCLRSKFVVKVTMVRAAEREMAEKRADYFAAGTKVVWDVDLLSEDVVRVYRAESPDAADRFIAVAKPPKRNRRCRVGSFLSMNCLSKANC